MNIILFSPDEVELPIPRADRRARHILEVLRRRAGETFAAGIIDGPLGTGTLVAVRPDHLVLSFAWAHRPPPLAPLHLIVGLSRPQTVRDVLRELSALGIARLEFVSTTRTEPGYRQSSVWQPAEIRRCLAAGAEQAFSTLLPHVTVGHDLAACLAALTPGGTRVALDNYEGVARLYDIAIAPSPAVVLAIGAERGWSDTERAALRASGFMLVGLGGRVLRTETACIAAVSLVLAKCGWL